MEVVKDFDYRSDFCAAYKGAFNAAKEDGYLDDLFKDKPNNGYKNALVMISMKEKKETGKAIYWTKERAIEEGRRIQFMLRQKKVHLTDTRTGQKNV